MKTVLLYILTVGILFIGLLGILNIGETLAAPPDVSGTWEVQDLDVVSRQSCINVNSKLRIEQSGIYLSVYLNDAELTSIKSKFQKNRIRLAGNLPTECGEETKIKLEINLQKQSSDQFEAVWSAPGCSNCRRIHFSAVRTSRKGL